MTILFLEDNTYFARLAMSQWLRAGFEAICCKMAFSTIISVLEARFGAASDW